MVGWTQSNFGMWNGAISDPPSMICNCCQSASGRWNTCNLSFNSDPSSGRRVLHSISGEEISPTMKATPAPAALTIRTAATARGMR